VTFNLLNLFLPFLHNFVTYFFETKIERILLPPASSRVFSWETAFLNCEKMGKLHKNPLKMAEYCGFCESVGMGVVLAIYTFYKRRKSIFFLQKIPLL